MNEDSEPPEEIDVQVEPEAVIETVRSDDDEPEEPVDQEEHEEADALLQAVEPEEEALVVPEEEAQDEFTDAGSATLRT